MKVPVDIKKAFKHATQGVHVMSFAPGKREIPEDSAKYMEEQKFGVILKQSKKKD